MGPIGPGAPTGPSFQGYKQKRGCIVMIPLRKTFDPQNWNYSEPVFGGAQGDTINGIYYDEQELEFCPEADGKGYYFEILPALNRINF